MSIKRMGELADLLSNPSLTELERSRFADEFFAIDNRMRANAKRSKGVTMSVSNADVAKAVQEGFLAEAKAAHAGMLAAGLRPKSTVEEFAAILKAEALQKIESGEASGELGALCAVKEIDWPVHK